DDVLVVLVHAREAGDREHDRVAPGAFRPRVVRRDLRASDGQLDVAGGDALGVGDDRLGQRDARRQHAADGGICAELQDFPSTQGIGHPSLLWSKDQLDNKPFTSVPGSRPAGRIPSHVTARLSARRRSPRTTYRSSRKNARTSAASASGSSSAAKWPPAGIAVQRRMLYVRSAHARGGSRISRGNAAYAV